MYSCRLITVIVFATVYIGCNAYLHFEETEQNAQLTMKIANVNDTLHKMLEIRFLTKTVQAVSSMDPTVKNLITTMNNVSIYPFVCIERNVFTLPASTVYRLSLSTLTPIIVEACPQFANYFYAVENATIAIKKRLDKYTPEVIAKLPPGIYTLLTDALDFGLLLFSDVGMRNSVKLQEAIIDEMVIQINSLNNTDRKAFAKLVPWTAPFITSNGKYSDALRDTLNAINTGLQQSFNISKLAPALTKLTLGVASKLPAIVRWVYNKIDALPISDSVYKNTNFTDVATSLAKIGNMYGKSAVRSYAVTKTIELLLGGRFRFTNYVPTYSNYKCNFAYYD